MNAPKDKLFTPLAINGFLIKNRIGLAPMTRLSAGPAGIPRQDVFDFLVRRARNGVSIVYSEALLTDNESAQGYPGQSRLLTAEQINAWRPVTQAIRDAGAVSVAQLFHCGRVSYPDVNPARRIIAPSAIPPRNNNALTGQPYPMPDAMTQTDIDRVIEGFVQSARGAMAAGFDGVEIHGAHGFLISQFLSSTSNQRNDRYGGSVENRCRFAREVIRGVRSAVPRDKLLFFRISDWAIPDLDVSLFGTKSEYQQIIKLLSQEPIDAISVSTQNFAARAYGTDRTMAEITREATELPIFQCGGIYDRTTADNAIKNADVVFSAKSLLLNPDWIADIKVGKSLNPYSSQDANVAYTATALL